MFVLPPPPLPASPSLSRAVALLRCMRCALAVPTSPLRGLSEQEYVLAVVLKSASVMVSCGRLAIRGSAVGCSPSYQHLNRSSHSIAQRAFKTK